MTVRFLHRKPIALEERFLTMTGNNKVWRAPVAGLASVAMLATLGVTVMTANASELAPEYKEYKVSFTVKGSEKKWPFAVWCG